MNNFHLDWIKDDWSFWYYRTKWWAKPFTFLGVLVFTIILLIDYLAEQVINNSIKEK